MFGEIWRLGEVLGESVTWDGPIMVVLFSDP